MFCSALICSLQPIPKISGASEVCQGYFPTNFCDSALEDVRKCCDLILLHHACALGKLVSNHDLQRNVLLRSVFSALPMSRALTTFCLDFVFQTV